MDKLISRQGSEEVRCCCNCLHNIRCPKNGDIAHIECHCELDNHYIGYTECFEGWCKEWARETKFDRKETGNVND